MDEEVAGEGPWWLSEGVLRDDWLPGRPRVVFHALVLVVDQGHAQGAEVVSNTLPGSSDQDVGFGSAQVGAHEVTCSLRQGGAGRV